MIGENILNHDDSVHGKDKFPLEKSSRKVYNYSARALVVQCGGFPRRRRAPNRTQRLFQSQKVGRAKRVPLIPIFPNEFRIFRAFGGAHCFSPRSRFEPKISLASTFLQKGRIRSNFVQFCATFSQFWKGSSQSFCLCERL